MLDANDKEINELDNNNLSKVIRARLNVVAGVIPFAGSALAVASAAWPEHDQDRANKFLKYRQQLL